jgi:hypothetical protein
VVVLLLKLWCIWSERERDQSGESWGERDGKNKEEEKEK